MIFTYRKTNGDLGQVVVEVSDSFTFDDAVTMMKHELQLPDKTRILGVLTKEDYKENTNV